MRQQERGAGTSEVFFVIALFVYFTFMGYVANASGHTTNMIGGLSSWQIPTLSLHTGTTGFLGWIFGATIGIVDVLIVLLNILGWVLGALVSYAAFIGFSVPNYPVWITTLLIAPMAIGMGWLILSLMRGRE